MDKFKVLVKYFLLHYPKKEDLSASRLTKLVYLSDWKNVLEHDEQLTETKWYFNHYGPYVDHLTEISNQNDSGIVATETLNAFGGKKKCFNLKSSSSANNQELLQLSRDEKNILDFVISKTQDKNYDDFIRLVYSTYPVANSAKYSDLDLVALGCEYKHMLKSNTVRH